MSRFAIVTDGTCTLPAATVRELDIELVPLHVLFGADDYTLGASSGDLSHERFYEMLERRKEHPSTSAPSLGEVHEVFERILGTGVRDVLAITMDANRSVTHSVVSSAAQAMRANIVVVDSGSVSGGLGMLVSVSARARRAGRSFQDTVALAQRLAKKPVLLVYVDTLEFLRRSGRVPAVQALFGSLLQVKPLLRFAAGEVENVDRQRTRSRGLARLRELAVASLGEGSRARVCVLHTNASEDASRLAEWAQSTFHCVDFFVEEAGPVLATHVGPGVLAIGYLKEDA